MQFVQFPNMQQTKTTQQNKKFHSQEGDYLSNNSKQNDIEISDGSQRTQRSINKSQSTEKTNIDETQTKIIESQITMTVALKQRMVDFTSKEHDGTVYNYLQQTVLSAISYCMYEKNNLGNCAKSGNFSLMSSLPNNNVLAKLHNICTIMTKQPAYPKFSYIALTNVIDVAMAVYDNKTKRKYLNLTQILTNMSVSPESSVDTSNFVTNMNKIVHAKTKQEKEIIWKNNFGFKFNLNDAQIPKFSDSSKLCKFHLRMPEHMKTNLIAIVQRKYSGKIRDTWSFEICSMLDEYLTLMENKKTKKLLPELVTSPRDRLTQIKIVDLLKTQPNYPIFSLRSIFDIIRKATNSEDSRTVKRYAKKIKSYSKEVNREVGIGSTYDIEKYTQKILKSKSSINN